MIKITVDHAVYAALSAAFPKPAASAHRALGKYISVLEGMLFKSLHYEATPMQRKLDLFTISLEKLAQQGGQIGPRKIRLHKWLRENNLNLVEPVILGSNLTGGVSQCKVTSLVTMVDTLAIEEKILSTATNDRQLDQYLSGDDFSNYQLLNVLFPEYKQRITQAEEDQLFDFVPIDRESLKSYIVWLATEADKISAAKKTHALRQARVILGLASVMDSQFVQRKKPSVFGRMYYEGTSMQNVNKELRRAALGDCWEYDIRSSVVAWKMGFAKGYLGTHAPGQDLRRVFMSTLSFLEDKADFMATVRHFTFSDDSPVPRDLQPKLLKQAFTAISFGARQNTTGWKTDSGEWTNPALVDILKNGEDRERFLSDSIVQGFIQEQALLDNFFFEKVKAERKDLLSVAYLQTPSGRPSKSKILAYLYQHDETEIMEVVRSVAERLGRKPIARVHDAIFFKRKLSVEMRSEIEQSMREYSDNQYWYLTPKQLERYQPRLLDVRMDESAHKDRIAAEEARALAHYANFSDD